MEVTQMGVSNEILGHAGPDLLDGNPQSNELGLKGRSGYGLLPPRCPTNRCRSNEDHIAHRRALSRSSSRSQNQNRAERAIKFVKAKCKYIMRKAPKRLWPYGLPMAVILCNHQARKWLQWKCPEERRSGVTPDISHLRYGFYSPALAATNAKFPDDGEEFVRLLGPAESTGDALTYYCLHENGAVVARSVFRIIDESEVQSHRTHCWHSDTFLCSTSSLTNQRTRAHHSSNPTNEITNNWEFTYSQPIGSIP
eukprot:scaffold3908_cov191-Pinguiococcus_pyrenoidosus.AAC.1